MELNLPSLMTAEQLTAWAAEIAIVIGIVQHLSWIPIPEGSKARAWLICVLAAAVVAFTALGSLESEMPALIASVVVSWAGLSSAALGLNRAGSLTVRAAQEKVNEAAEPDSPTLNTRGDAP